MKFLAAILADENGTPDEANLAFIAFAMALIAGAFLIAFGYPFPLDALAASAGTIIPLYRASRGDWRGNSNPPTLQKDITP